MRKRLMRSYWLGNLLTLLLVVAFVAVMVVSDIQSDRGSLQAILRTASAWTAEASSNLQQLADQIAQAAPPMRVTFVMPNGIVLADSGGETPDGGELVSRPEVLAALAGDTGDHLSFSDSLIYPTLNAAVLLNGRLVLHLQKPIEEISYVLMVYLPLMALLLGAMAAISRLLIDPVTRRMVRQLEQVQELLEGTTRREDIDPETYFPELRPAMEQLTYLIDRMRYDLEQIRKNQDMQRDFVDNSSHELKSPLTSILGFAEMIYDEPDMPLPQRQEYLGYILTECQRMSDVISDILMLERQERVDSQGHERQDLRKIADQVAAVLKPQAQSRGIHIHVKGQLQVCALEVDMRELLRNLISNAVRYGRSGGWVRVEMGEGRLAVRDNGMGIAPEHQARIFEKFYRADAARDRREGGTGLGLSIVAGITNRYGAKIHVDSRLGEGSCFTVDFPDQACKATKEDKA
ncbi:MAG: sensor histidine kinase [Christensenellales bacterium]|jgi:signal transduction histidine kinase